MKAILLLEDGTVFKGSSFGAEAIACGEAVFNTSMAGYQEILTDPSYNEQIITMTYPLIGNYGTNKLDVESRKVFARGFVVKENCDYPSSWRNEISLADYLKKNNIVALEGVDTRKIVKHIRTKGAMRAIISSAELKTKKLMEKLQKYPGLEGRDIVKNVTAKKSYKWDKGSYDICQMIDIPPEAFWAEIDMNGPDFWENLEEYPWYDDMYKLLEQLAAEYGAEPVTFATSPSQRGLSIAMWLSGSLLLPSHTNVTWAFTGGLRGNFLRSTIRAIECP